MKFGGLVLLNAIDINAKFFFLEMKWYGTMDWWGSRFKQGASMEDLNLNSKLLWGSLFF